MKKLFSVLTAMVSIGIVLMSGSALAAEEAAEAASRGDLVKFALALAAGFGMAIASAAGAAAQGKSVAAAMEGIARNPEARPHMFVPMIIGLALIESLVIYTLVIAIFLQGKI